MPGYSTKFDQYTTSTLGPTHFAIRQFPTGDGPQSRANLVFCNIIAAVKVQSSANPDSVWLFHRSNMANIWPEYPELPWTKGRSVDFI